MGSTVAYMQLNIEALKALRETSGDSQKSLAVRAGISEYALNLIEVGKSKPRNSTIKKLADALGVSVGAIAQADRERQAS